jgi:hypothetical protein
MSFKELLSMSKLIQNFACASSAGNKEINYVVSPITTPKARVGAKSASARALQVAGLPQSLHITYLPQAMGFRSAAGAKASRGIINGLCLLYSSFC